MLKIILYTGIIFLGLNSVIVSQTTGYIPVKKFDPERETVKDISDAIKEAQQTNRRILLDIGGEWCIWCRILDNFIESNPEVEKFLHDNYVVVKVNYSKENKNENVLSEYPEIPGYPHFFILDKTGRFLHSQGTAELEENKSYSVEKMMTFLKKWALPEE
jgi:thioredoxin-related protein